MFSSSDKDNWTLSCSDRAECPTTISMAIKLRDNNGTNLDCFIEGKCLIVASLTNAPVHNEERSVWLDCQLHLLHFLKQSCLLFMSSRGIYNDDFKLLLSEEVHSFLGNFNRVCFFLVSKEGAFDLGCIHLQLFEGTSSESVSAHQTNSPSFSHVVVGELGTGGCLTRPLKTNEHDNIGLSLLEFVWLVLALEHVCKFLNHSLLDESSHIRSTSILAELQGDLSPD